MYPHGDPPKKQLGQFFHPLRVTGPWSKLFLAIGPEKEYPKLVSKFWGFPNKFVGGIKVSPKFRDFPTFLPISPQRSKISPIWKRIIELRTLAYNTVTKWRTLKFPIWLHKGLCKIFLGHKKVRGLFLKLAPPLLKLGGLALQSPPPAPLSRPWNKYNISLHCNKISCIYMAWILSC